jgi:hypothetical protein
MGGQGCISGLVTKVCQGESRDKDNRTHPGVYWPIYGFLLPHLFQAKIDLRTVFEGLPQDEQDAIIDPKGTNKLPPKDTNKPNLPSNATAEQTDQAERKDSPSLREPSVTTNEHENIDVCSSFPCPCHCIINKLR